MTWGGKKPRICQLLYELIDPGNDLGSEHIYRFVGPTKFGTRPLLHERHRFERSPSSEVRKDGLTVIKTTQDADI